MKKFMMSMDYASRMSNPEPSGRLIDGFLWFVLILITIASVLAWWFKIRVS